MQRNAIARRPVFDTIGIGLSVVVNITSCIILVPLWGKANGLYGTAIAVVLSNFVNFMFRTITAQKLYRTIRNPFKTLLAFVLALLLTACGVMFSNQFLIKGVLSLLALALYCFLYKKQFTRIWQTGLAFLKMHLGMAK